jgi:hypothetical protein
VDVTAEAAAAIAAETVVAAAVAEVGEVAGESLGFRRHERWSSRPQTELRRLFEALRNSDSATVNL